MNPNQPLGGGFGTAPNPQQPQQQQPFGSNAQFGTGNQANFGGQSFGQQQQAPPVDRAYLKRKLAGILQLNMSNMSQLFDLLDKRGMTAVQAAGQPGAVVSPVDSMSEQQAADLTMKLQQLDLALVQMLAIG